jgi:TPR repeat protein
MMKQMLSLVVVSLLVATPLSAVAGWKGDYRAALSSNNHSRALDIVQSAVSRGDAEAEFTLGLLYHAGQGVPHDDERALAWMRVGVEGGFRAGQSSAAHLEERLSPGQRQRAHQLAESIRVNKGRR